MDLDGEIIRFRKRIKDLEDSFENEVRSEIKDFMTKAGAHLHELERRIESLEAVVNSHDRPEDKGDSKPNPMAGALAEKSGAEITGMINSGG